MFSSGGKRTINDQMAPSLRQFPPSGAADQYTLTHLLGHLPAPIGVLRQGATDKVQTEKTRKTTCNGFKALSAVARTTKLY